MAVRHILSQTGLQQLHQGVLWPSSVSLQKGLFSVSRSSSDEPDRPDERQQTSQAHEAHAAGTSARFFGDGVKAVVGTAAQKFKQAVGLEKQHGKEGSQGMEPAGVMENKNSAGDKSSQYEELIDKHKKTNDELLKGANVSDLYAKENTHATSAANTKTGGDPELGGKGSSGAHDK